MATTMHWLPNFSAPARTNSRFCTAAVLMRDLVGAGEQKIANVVDRAHAAADRERHEAGFRRAPHDIEQRAAILVARGDVEKAEFVRARRIIGDGAGDGIARIAQTDEIDAFDDAAVLHVETGDDARFKQGSSPPRGPAPKPPADRAGHHKARGR